MRVQQCLLGILVTPEHSLNDHMTTGPGVAAGVAKPLSLTENIKTRYQTLPFLQKKEIEIVSSLVATVHKKVYVTLWCSSSVLHSLFWVKFVTAVLSFLTRPWRLFFSF